MHLESKKFKCIVPGKISSSSAIDTNIDYAVKNWKKILENNLIIEKCYEQKFHVKPSDKKRKQLEIAKYNQRKEYHKNEQ